MQDGQVALVTGRSGFFFPRENEAEERRKSNSKMTDIYLTEADKSDRDGFDRNIWSELLLDSNQ